MESKLNVRTFYVGDGHNDYCPSLRLSERDVIFARTGYKLEKMLKKELTGDENDSEVKKVKAKVVFYDDANAVVEELKSCARSK
jgi:pyridoxal phosphate phosphatase PHOSPHO2